MFISVVALSRRVQPAVSNSDRIHGRRRNSNVMLFLYLARLFDKRPRVDGSHFSSAIGPTVRASRSPPGSMCRGVSLTLTSDLRLHPLSLSLSLHHFLQKRGTEDDGEGNEMMPTHASLPTRTHHYRRPCRALYRRRLAYAIIAARDVCVSTPVLSLTPDHRLSVLDTLGNNTVFLTPGDSTTHLVKTAG
jgi:hypothetical protein